MKKNPETFVMNGFGILSYIYRIILRFSRVIVNGDLFAFAGASNIGRNKAASFILYPLN